MECFTNLHVILVGGPFYPFFIAPILVYELLKRTLFRTFMIRKKVLFKEKHHEHCALPPSPHSNSLSPLLSPTQKETGVLSLGFMGHMGLWVESKESMNLVGKIISSLISLPPTEIGHFLRLWMQATSHQSRSHTLTFATSKIQYFPVTLQLLHISQNPTSAHTILKYGGD